MQRIEDAIVDWALLHVNTQEQAATMLGVNRTTLVEKLRRRTSGSPRRGPPSSTRGGSAGTSGSERLRRNDASTLAQAWMDEEHRRILALVGEVRAAVLERQVRKARRLHWQLLDLIDVHREHEEQTLAAAGFPHLAEHRVEHAWLTSKLRALRLDAESPAGLSVLASCILQHMLGADREAAPWLAEPTE
jgi:hemerythrin-like metal-binding protein